MFAILMLAQVAGCAQPTTQMAMNRCASIDHQREDAAMTVQWKKTLAYMREQDREANSSADKRPSYADTLLESQRAWLRFRDTQCAIEGYAARGGSMEPMLIAGCKASMTAARRKTLASLIMEY
jgi:uncharacterized protein YecT (DUF1311 family)